MNPLLAAAGAILLWSTLAALGHALVHFLLFLALRLAPPVEANLVNYLWPLLIVLLTPLIRVAKSARRGRIGTPCRAVRARFVFSPAKP